MAKVKSFWYCKKHPRYHGVRPPTAPCVGCWYVYMTERSKWDEVEIRP